MAAKFVKLFEPIDIGKVQIKNRIAMAPMGIVGLLNPNGSPTQRAIDYYIERARGGVGLIITSLFKVEKEIDPSSHHGPLISNEALPPLAELAESIHAFGSRIFVQLTAGFGRVAHPMILRGKTPVSASSIPNYWQPSLMCRELKTAEVEMLVKSFGIAARFLAFAGIDGIELHGHEGYLFDQFTTGLWNKRNDRYGGDLSGRLRFPIEVLNEIKQNVGKDFPVQYRFGLKHYIKGLNEGVLPGEPHNEAGRDIEEGLKMAKMLEAAGFDALHVDAGCYDSWYWAHPPIYQVHGCMAEMAAEAKKVVKIPVIAVGRLETPELAEEILASGKADIVALGRGLLTDAFWVKKVEEGRAKKIRPCIGCHDGCMGRIFLGRPISCAVNPAVGRERSYAIEKAERSKRVIIIGGGTAGLEAARTAAIRGHRVTLYEKKGVLGGWLNAGCIPSFKKDLLGLIQWYESEMEDLGVEVKLGVEASPGLLAEANADVLVVATGAQPIMPKIPGIEKEFVATAPEVLLGTKKCGERAIIIGGGLVGCETAAWLAQQKKKVTVVEMLEDLMLGRPPVAHMNRMMLLDMLRFHGVEILTNSRVSEVKDGAVLLTGGSQEKKERIADTVIIAAGLEPDRDLYHALLGTRPKPYLIGDAREARNIMGAVWDAYEVARAL
jgi:2-enoate reductase